MRRVLITQFGIVYEFLPKHPILVNIVRSPPNNFRFSTRIPSCYDAWASPASDLIGSPRAH